MGVALESAWLELDTLSSAKDAVLRDDLAREELKDRIRVQDLLHARLFESLQSWGERALHYSQSSDIDVSSSAEATARLKALGSFNVARQDMARGDVAELKRSGEALRAASHATAHSSWRLQGVELASVLQRETSITEMWAAMEGASVKKRAHLDDALQRELYAEATRLLSAQHSQEAARLQTWAAEQLSSIENLHAATDAADAETRLARLEAHTKEFVVLC
jgi:hypothetical protein